MQIIPAFVTQNKCYQAGAPLTPRGIMLHSVGTPQPSARALVRYMDQYQPGGQSVCVHAVAQADGTVYRGRNDRAERRHDSERGGEADRWHVPHSGGAVR